jgi:hypothetical protein
MARWVLSRRLAVVKLCYGAIKQGNIFPDDELGL